MSEQSFEIGYTSVSASDVQAGDVLTGGLNEVPRTCLVMAVTPVDNGVRLDILDNFAGFVQEIVGAELDGSDPLSMGVHDIHDSTVVFALTDPVRRVARIGDR